MATPVSNAVPQASNPLANGLIQGSKWTFAGEKVLTYSFNLNFDIDSGGHVSTGVGGSWTGSPLKAVLEKAIAAWSNVVDIRFASFFRPTRPTSI